MIVSIHQPHFLPWLGYFHRIAASDLHIALDHVQFEKNSFINRNKVRTQKEWTWLTVPVWTTGSFGDLAIDKLRIAEGHNWRNKHWKTLKFNYRKAENFDAYSDFFRTPIPETGFLSDILSRKPPTISSVLWI